MVVSEQLKNTMYLDTPRGSDRVLSTTRLKRKRGLGDDVTGPLPSLLGNNLDKRICGGYKRSKQSKTKVVFLRGEEEEEQEEEMSELVNFILDYEEAFQRFAPLPEPHKHCACSSPTCSRNRIQSLYSDFRKLQATNPEGYQTNLSIWQKALANAARAGVVPAPGATRNLLTIHTGLDLARALSHKDHGMPTCLPAVFQDAIHKKAFIPDHEFKNAAVSIYTRSWVPSVKDVLQWGFRMLAGPGNPDKLPQGTFVIVQNVEAAAEEVLKQFHGQPQTSSADRILSRTAFLKRFANVLNPTHPLTVSDLDIILIHLARDKQEISFNDRVVKFKADAEDAPLPVTNEDMALAELRDAMDNVNATLPILHAKTVALHEAAREAVQEKHTIRAKTALRSKKLAESALAHRTAVALQLEEAYTKLQQAADQVDIIEAMKAGADAMSVLNQKVGGAEGVQDVMDRVNEQMATTDEITNIINENATPIDEGEVDDEIEAMERTERERTEVEEAAVTAARLAELGEAEKARKEKEQAEAAKEESGVATPSRAFSQLSVEGHEEDEKMLEAA
jgi:charged multivesicular body protein 7